MPGRTHYERAPPGSDAAGPPACGAVVMRWCGCGSALPPPPLHPSRRALSLSPVATLSWSVCAPPPRARSCNRRRGVCDFVCGWSAALSKVPAPRRGPPHTAGQTGLDSARRRAPSRESAVPQAVDARLGSRARGRGRLGMHTYLCYTCTCTCTCTCACTCPVLS